MNQGERKYQNRKGGRTQEVATREEFFSERNKGGLSEEEFASNVYIAIHTLYLEPLESNSRVMMSRYKTFWKKTLGDAYIPTNIFNYMLNNENILITDRLIHSVNSEIEISVLNYVKKAVVALEFDLWLIERYMF